MVCLLLCDQREVHETDCCQSSLYSDAVGGKLDSSFGWMSCYCCQPWCESISCWNDGNWHQIRFPIKARNGKRLQNLAHNLLVCSTCSWQFLPTLAMHVSQLIWFTAPWEPTTFFCQMATESCFLSVSVFLSLSLSLSVSLSQNMCFAFMLIVFSIWFKCLWWTGVSVAVMDEVWALQVAFKNLFRPLLIWF